MKRTALIRRTPLRRARTSPAWLKVRRFVIGRSDGRCEARIEDVCTGRAVHAHHIILRSQGGPDETWNLLAVCSACHEHTHRNPAWAESVGLLRRRSA